MESLDTRQETFTATPMAIAEQAYLRLELERRQSRLKSALVSPLASASFTALLDQVDAALARLDQGTY